MKKLEYNINIAASRQHVWNTMIDPVTYPEWVNASWPGSGYKGKWEQGEKIGFVSTSGEGTLAEIVEQKPYDHIFAKHIAVINADGSEDTESSVAQRWVGTTEDYYFTDNNGKTDLKVVIQAYPEWQQMFDDGWPPALNKLKEMCER